MYMLEYEDLADAPWQLGRCLDAVSNTKRVRSALCSLTPDEFEQHDNII
jgi:hypothetical protein